MANEGDSDGQKTVIERKSIPDPASSAPSIDSGPMSAQSLQLPASVDIATIVAEVRLPPAERIEMMGTLASGGMGRVDLVHDRALARRVARKALHGELLGREKVLRLFLHEARVTGQLDHPNIVPVYDIGESPDGGLYFTMKLVNGKTLKELVKELPEGPIDSGMLFDLLDIVIKVCDALAFAHARGVVHCDVKPENVMVGDYGQVYLMDWGVARLLEQRDEAAAIIGTAAYMSPEQARGERGSLDARSDVFLVGSMLYEMVTRKAPYRSPTADEALRRASTYDFVPPRNATGERACPQDLERVILKAMEKAPRERYPDTDALKDDLIRFMRGNTEFPLQTFPKGSYIVREGELGNTAYIIKTGKCEVLKVIEGTVTPLQTLGSSDVFGEMAVLTESPRTATVLALEDTIVYVVEGDVLRREMDAMKPWMAMLLKRLAQRFTDIYRSRRVTSTFMPSLPAVRVCNQLLMTVRTWGTAKEDGTLTAKWSKIASDMEAQQGAPPMSIGAVVKKYVDHVSVDIDEDIVEIRDPDGLKKKLELDLKK